jgi:hypothetical protein
MQLKSDGKYGNLKKIVREVVQPCPRVKLLAPLPFPCNYLNPFAIIV